MSKTVARSFAIQLPSQLAVSHLFRWCNCALATSLEVPSSGRVRWMLILRGRLVTRPVRNLGIWNSL